MAQVIDEIQVCQDCLMVIANNDWTGIEDRDVNRVKAGIKALAAKGYACVGDSDKDAGFRWRHCDCCNGLPGHHYHVIILGEVTE
jgi:hypothetical protein